MALAIIDVDKFKSINDSCGHLIGDRILESLATIIRTRFRHDDLVGRWGGDEFVLVVRRTSREDAAKLLERVIEDFKHHPSSCAKCAGESGATFSAGVVTLDCESSEWEACLREADSRLYRAKAAGRARVVCQPKS